MRYGHGVYSEYQLQLVIVGDSQTGKSSMMVKYLENVFNSSVLPTIGIEIKLKFFGFQDFNGEMQIWDTPGKEEFRSVILSYLAGANAVFLLFDRTYRSSFENIELWLRGIKSVLGNDAIIFLVGNKSDLNVVLSSEEAQEKALLNNILYMETSSREGNSVNVLFEVLLHQLVYSVEIRNFLVK